MSGPDPPKTGIFGSDLVAYYRGSYGGAWRYTSSRLCDFTDETSRTSYLHFARDYSTERNVGANHQTALGCMGLPRSKIPHSSLDLENGNAIQLLLQENNRLLDWHAA